MGQPVARGLFGAAAGLFLAVSAVSGQTAAYLNHEELTNELRSITEASEFGNLRPLATSEEGREVWLVALQDPDGSPEEERPGVLIVGNLEGDHVLGSQLVLEIGRFLLSGEDDQATALAEYVFYLIPRLNPDGAEAMFGDVLADRSVNARPIDDDNDGRTDEDPAEDLNGDGLITVMRVPDALGLYVLDEVDPRLMVEAELGQGRSGAYSIHWEGLDSDGDGFVNEDGFGGVDLNRNFQHEYPYYSPGAGPHMVSEPETRALMDFVISHRNIAAVLTFGHSDNLVTPPDADGNLGPGSTRALSTFANTSNREVFDVGVFPPGTLVGGLELRGVRPGADNDPDSGRRPAVSANEDDVEYFDAVSESYREITGIERVAVNREAQGAFFQYGYFQFGVPSFSTQGWGLSLEEADGDAEDQEETDGSPDASLLRALEAEGLDAFVNWDPYDHPELGAVEIGGLRPYATTNPPADRIPDLGRRHGEFVLSLVEMLPSVGLASTEVESHGGGLFTLTVDVENTGFFPSALRHGVVSGSVPPVVVQIGVAREDLITGDALTSEIPQLAGSGTRARFSWVIRGESGDSVEIRVRSQKGGTEVIRVALEEG